MDDHGQVWTEHDKGQLFMSLGVIKQQNADQEKQLDTLFTKVDGLTREGCAIGTANAARLSVIEKNADAAKGNSNNGPGGLTITLSAAGIAAVASAAVFVYFKITGG